MLPFSCGVSTAALCSGGSFGWIVITVDKVVDALPVQLEILLVHVDHGRTAGQLQIARDFDTERGAKERQKLMRP